MWAYNETFYQIYPIGFCGAPTHNDGICVPRILKLKDWSSYLENLQIGSVLLNPIFESDNHGYDTRDFKKVDCRLGTNEDFQDVCDDLHKHHIKIVLDGVFNHVGRGFRKRSGILLIKTGSTSILTVTVVIRTDSGMRDGKDISNWSN